MDLKLHNQKLHSSIQGEILLPKHFNDETEQRILAAIASVVLDTSVDYTLKKYIKQIEKPNKSKTLTDEIIDEIQLRIDEIYKKHDSIDYKQENIKTFGVHMCLKRLKSSYEVSMFLIYMGYYFEANTIIRLVFEQLAFCTNLGDVTDEEYKKLKPSDIQLSSTNINKLKTLISDINIGSLYGDLSNKAHMNIKEVSNYLRYNQELKEVLIVQRSQNLTLISANLLLIICYIHESVLEYSFKDYLNNFEFIKKKEKRYISKPNKKYHATIKKYQQLIINEPSTEDIS